VFADFAEHQRHYGDVSQLPTPVFFYGLGERDEMAVTMDQGKAIVVRLNGRTDVDEEGMVKLFFELNGQPRDMRVHKAGAVSTVQVHPKADPANPKHVAAPMPGMVSTVAVKAGAKVTKGSPLVSIEAMKMESMITAESDGTVVKVYVVPGDKVDAKDLMIELG
jgi:pyruvate carboxylase